MLPVSMFWAPSRSTSGSSNSSKKCQTQISNSGNWPAFTPLLNQKNHIPDLGQNETTSTNCHELPCYTVIIQLIVVLLANMSRPVRRTAKSLKPASLYILLLDGRTALNLVVHSLSLKVMFSPMLGVIWQVLQKSCKHFSPSSGCLGLNLGTATTQAPLAKCSL